ncbi:MAG: hypothetical protein ACXVGB_10205 [Mycobacteriaceae bacterium]
MTLFDAACGPPAAAPPANPRGQFALGRTDANSGGAVLADGLDYIERCSVHHGEWSEMQRQEYVKRADALGCQIMGDTDQ